MRKSREGLIAESLAPKSPAAVGAAVGEVAGEEILDEADEFGFAEVVVGFDGVAADRLGDHVFAEAQFAGLRAGLAEVVDDLAQERGRFAAAQEGRQAVDLERVFAEGLGSGTILIWLFDPVP